MTTSNGIHPSSCITSATNHHHRLPSNSQRGAGGRRSSDGSGSTTTTVDADATATPTPACAACKYQRLSSCNPDCKLAPYFPADHQDRFLNAHRLFGVCNILKIIHRLDPTQRTAAMNSIIFQSDARAQDPVGGCYRIILDLQRQIERDSAELDQVLRQLAVCRAQAQEQQAQPQPPPPELSIINGSTTDVGDQNDDPGHHAQGTSTLHQQQQQQQRHGQEILAASDEDDRRL